MTRESKAVFLRNKIAEKHPLSGVLPGLAVLQCSGVCGAVSILK